MTLGGYTETVSNIHMPTEVDERVGFFDRFAGHAAKFASRAPFFAGCVLLILIWAPTIFVLSFDTSQLLMNTATTIVTFLLVALLQNSQTRNDQATQHKLNAIADGLADAMERFADYTDDDSLRDEIRELRSAVGLEDRESTTKVKGKGRQNGQSAKAGARS
jgi:low affinity Fe/Cu permease